MRRFFILILLTLHLAPFTTLASQETLKVGIHKNFKTLEYVSSKKKPAGLLVELWKEWSRDSGKSLEFVYINDTDPISFLNNGTVDILANAPPDSPLVYSEPYAQLPFYFISLKNRYLETRDQFPVRAGISLVEKTFVKTRLPAGMGVETFVTYHEMLQALRKGTIDLIISNDASLNHAIATFDLLDLHYAKEPFYTHGIRAGALKGHAETLKLFSEKLAGQPKARKAALVANWQPDTIGFRLPWPLIGTAIFVLSISGLLVFFWLINRRLEQQVAIQTLELQKQKQELQIDIERRQELEHELRAAKEKADADVKAKSHFLANITHELRTPLIGVLGMNELLQKTDLSSQQKGMTETIQTSGETLLSLISDLLEFTKAESNHLRLNPEAVNFPALIVDTVQLLADQLNSKPVSMACHVEPNAYWEVLADPLRLRQVLLNLLSNATKFTLEGGITVRLGMQPAGEKRGRFCLEVEDTGIGVSAEEQVSIFSPFTQASNVHKGTSGTGLGLAIVKQLIEQMNGTIDLESQLEQGSTFRVTVEFELLKKLDAPRKETSTFTQETVQRPVPGASNEILVVDDYPITLQLVEQHLASDGYEINTASNGYDALEMTQARAFALILMDCNMPELDGLETTRALRDQGYQGAIVALTAHIDRQIEIDCHQAGMNDCLSKPFRRAELLAMVSKWLPDHTED